MPRLRARAPFLPRRAALTLTRTHTPPPTPAVWGETADGSDVLQTIFPRAAASAERQWSYDVVTNSTAPNVEYRLQAFRCFLLERNIPAAPLKHSEARTAPPGPGSCMRQ